MFKHHQIKRALAGGLVIASVGLPASAQAMRTDGKSGPAAPAASVHVAWPVNGYSSRALHPYGSAGVAWAQPGSQSAFQWGDAGIGAAGAVALLGAAAAGVGVTRRRRTQQARVG